MKWPGQREGFFDECVPRPLRPLLPECDVATAQELGWGRLKNGELIRRAEEAGFEVFLTSDQNSRYQQNLVGRRIALLVLSTNYWPGIRTHSAEIEDALRRLQPGQYIEIQT